MPAKRRSRIRPKPVLAYLKKLYDSNLVLTDKSVMGMTNWESYDVFLNVDHPDHADIEEVLNTLTHEIIHRVSPTSYDDLTDPQTLAQQEADEAAVETITEELLRHPVWYAALTSWLLARTWTYVREARAKGVSFA
jgi:hypothetical protein